MQPQDLSKDSYTSTSPVGSLQDGGREAFFAQIGLGAGASAQHGAKPRINIVRETDRELTVNAALPGFFMAVGMAHFVLDERGLYGSMVHVEPEARRRSVATALHNFAEAHFGRPLTSSKELTEEGAAFLQSRGVALPDDVVIKPWDDWFGTPGSAESRVDQHISPTRVNSHSELQPEEHVEPSTQRQGARPR